MTRLWAEQWLRIGVLVVGAWAAVGGCARPDSRARVDAVYPTSDLLPANQLKLYIEFSAPMTTWEPYRYLRLIDEATGRPLPATFHQMRDGLWDPAGQRLTVLFDPGRIKRGLANHLAMGLPLEPGRSYRLEISGDWPDGFGRPMSEGFVKTFSVVAADRERPSVSDWLVRAPAEATVEPVVVSFGESLDYALLQRSIEVVDFAGRAVTTEFRSAEGESRCEIRPLAAWRPGAYRIVVDPLLEDLAGNNLNRVFDLDRAQSETKEPTPALELTFEVTGRS